MNIVNTPNAPAAIGPYSQGIIIDKTVYTSGQIPIDPSSNTIVSGGIEEQATQVMKNLAAILEQAGTNMDKIIKTTCFISNMNDFVKFNEVYQTYIKCAPARSCVEVSRLPKDVLCEVEVIAAL